MTLNCYFKFEKVPSKKSKYELIALTEKYFPIFNPDKNGCVCLYCYPTPESVKSNQRRKSDLSISIKSIYLSGVFIPDIEKPHLGYGDINFTEDAMIIILDNNAIEIFISKGNKNLAHQIYLLVFDGELENEIENLRLRAIKPNHAA